MIYSIGSIVVTQCCTAMRIKEGEERHVVTIYQKGMATEVEPDPEWSILAESELVYDENMSFRKHFTQLKETAKLKMVKY